MLFGVKDKLQTDLLSNNVPIKNRKVKKFLRITFDNKLEFNQPFTSAAKKANLKLNNLTKIKIYMTPEQMIFLTYFL